MLSIRPRRVLKRLVIGALCGAGWVCALADTPPEFQDGLKAYTSGDYAGALRYWKPIAEKGDAVAAFNLGVLYARGLGVSADPVVATGWYRRAADAGYALAQFNLGAAYMVGAGVGKDHVQAAQWWHKAASQDYAPAIYNLATLHLHGDGVKRDPDRARALYRRAAELGDERARDALASLATARPQPARVEAAHEAVPATASKTKSSPPKAVEPAKSVTVQPPAQATAVAAKQDEGKSKSGGERDTAFFARQDPKHWTIQLAAFDDPDSANLFMRTHRITGDGIVVTTRAKGQLWYKVLYGVFDERPKAVTAMNALSEHLRKRKPWLRTVEALQKEMVDTPVRKAAASAATKKAAAAPAAAPPVPAKSETQPGWRSTPKPETTAATEVPKTEAAPASAAPEKPPAAKPAKKSSRKSKDEKDKKIPKAEAQGVAPPPIPADAALKMQVAQSAFNVQDYDKAMGIWRPLAERGIAEAQYGTGFLYESGWGVARDYAKAYEWYRRAAEQGHAKAQFNLGMLYQGGLGVPKNESLALYWIQNAADRNDARAREFLKRSHREVGR